MLKMLLTYLNIVEDVMVIISGSNQAKYEIAASTLHSDIVGVMADGDKCKPNYDPTLPSDSDALERCENCIGIGFASRKGRWIHRCSGKDDSGSCKLMSIVLLIP